MTQCTAQNIHSFYVCVLVLFLFSLLCILYSVFLYCFVCCFSFCIYSCLSLIHRPIPPGGNPTAVNKYIIYVVFFLLGDSPASEFHVPTFRNPLFHLHKWCGQAWLGGDCQGIYTGKVVAQNQLGPIGKRRDVLIRHSYYSSPIPHFSSYTSF